MSNDYDQYSSCYMHGYAKSVGDAEIRKIVGYCPSPVELARIRLSFIGWAQDFGCFYETPWVAWSVFWQGYKPLETKTVLDMEDINNYVDALADVRKIGTDPVLKESFGVTMVAQLFAMNDSYIGSWLSCHVNYDTYFWILLDADWNFAVFTHMPTMRKQVFDLAGAGGFKCVHYAYGTTCTRIYESMIRP